MAMSFLRAWIASSAAVVALTAPVWSAAQEAGGQPSVPAGWKFDLPAGDPVDGKTVFMRMECYSCHQMSSLDVAVPADSGGIGPRLDGYDRLPKEYVAESIIKAHTVVAIPGYEVKGNQAGMGKYNHFMTIQELVDLVAFLGAPQTGK
jgi:hypothetical protein